MRPFFKPDWSPDHLETFNYVGYPACFRSTVAKECLQTGNYYDFILRFTERSQRISHVRKVLCHGLEPTEALEPIRAVASQPDIAALEGRLSRTGRSGIVTPGPLAPGYYEIAIHLRDAPLVSVVIPTAGKIVSMQDHEMDLILNCVTRIREHSTYKNVEVIVVDNGDLAADRVARLKDMDCKLVTYTEAVVNVAKSSI